MVIQDATFLKSATTEAHYPEGNLPEILLTGRSNVGKSSFINSLLRRKNIAHISSKPGKTQTLNFYLVNQAFHLVDVPGYGYAKVSKKDREAFGKMIETYLRTRESLKLVIQLVDFRHLPTEDDKTMHHFLMSYGIPCIVVGTKMDKVPKNQRPKQIKQIVQALGVDKDLFLPYSSVTHENQEEIYDLFDQILEESE